MGLSFLKDEIRRELTLRIANKAVDSNRAFTRKVGEIRHEHTDRGLLCSTVFVGAINGAVKDHMRTTSSCMLDSLFRLLFEEEIRIKKPHEQEISDWVSDSIKPIWKSHSEGIKREMKQRGLAKNALTNIEKSGDELIWQICNRVVPERCLTHDRSIKRAVKERRRSLHEKITWNFLIPLIVGIILGSGVTAWIKDRVTGNEKATSQQLDIDSTDSKTE